MGDRMTRPIETGTIPAIVKATPRGCSVAHITTSTMSIPSEVMRAALEAIADGQIEAFWRDPEHRTGLMFRAVD